MSHEVRAIIRWVPASRGGRSKPPMDSTGYCTPVRFESDPQESRGAWSLRILEAIELKGNEVIDAKVKFLVEDAPHELLQEGERFELMEGKKVVAKGVVMPSSLATPASISDFDVALLG